MRLREDDRSGSASGEVVKLARKVPGNDLGLGLS